MIKRPSYFSGRPRWLWGLAGLCVLAGSMGPGFAQSPSPTPAVRQVTIPFPQDDGTLTAYTFELGYSLVTLIYDTLMWRDEKGIPQPWLAEKVDVGPDNRRIMITLPEQVMWQDGQPLTSADVVFTFNYVREHQHPRFTSQLEAVESVSSIGPRTAVISLLRPSPGFLDQPLSDMPILPKHLWAGLPPGRVAPEGLPVGSGPYRLVRYLPEEGYRLEAFPGYFRAVPSVGAIEVPIINDAGKTLGAFERGRVDMLPINLPADAVARLESLSTVFARGPNYLGTVLMFNTRQPPFDRPEARRAAARAMDLQRITRNVGQATAASRGYLHPDSRYAPDDRIAAGRVQQRTETAGRFSVDILAPNNDPIKIEAGRQVTLGMRRAGIDAQMQKVSRDELSAAVGEDGSSPSFQAAIWGAPPLASYDPDFLRRLFGSDQKEASFNYSGYHNPAFDQLAVRIASTPEPHARQLAITDALKLLADDAPVVPLFFSQGAFAYRPSAYDGWVYVKGSGIFDKRSFVHTGKKPSGRSLNQRPPAPAIAEQPSRGFPFWILALGFVAAGLGVGIFSLVRARK